MKCAKNWQLPGCQFFHIMSNTHQTPLRFHFFEASQMESAEAHVLFDDPEHRFHFRTRTR
jgi:hypothetical protein